MWGRGTRAISRRGGGVHPTEGASLERRTVSTRVVRPWAEPPSHKSSAEMVVVTGEPSTKTT
eukprot:4758631-Prymnesium_polylepis.1